MVFSGDLTQRATRTQFREARAFLDGLTAPYLVIPGNHDVPLWNVARRFVTPLARYKRFITTDLDPVFQDDEIVVVGLNTARSFTWGEGRISRMQVAAALRRLQAAPAGVIKIVVTHHPFDLPPGVHERRLLGRARMAMAEFASVGAELFLSGHLHLSHVSHSAERYRIAGHSALIVQAGTFRCGAGARSRRSTCFASTAGGWCSAGSCGTLAEGRFLAVAVGEYVKEADGWKPLEAGEPENRRTGESKPS